MMEFSLFINVACAIIWISLLYIYISLLIANVIMLFGLKAIHVQVPIFLPSKSINIQRSEIFELIS